MKMLDRIRTEQRKTYIKILTVKIYNSSFM